MKKTSGFNRLKGLAGASTLAIAGIIGGMQSAKAAQRSTTLRINNTVSSASIGAIYTESTATSAGVGFYFVSFSVSNATLPAPYTSTMLIESSSNAAFGVNNAGISCSGTGMSTNAGNCFKSDAFDDHMGYWVNAAAYQSPFPTVDTANNQLTGSSKVDIVPGIDALQQIRLLPTGVIRSYFVLSNTTGSAIDVNVLYGGRLGSDDDTVIENSSDTDTTVDDSDSWYITSDGMSVDDPFITHVVKGDASTITNRTFARVSGRYSASIYSIKIPAGETKALLNFVQLSTDLPTANSRTDDFATLSNLYSKGLLADLNQDALDIIANYDSDFSIPGASVASSSSGSGSTSPVLIFLTGLLFSVRRAFNRK